MATPNRWTWRLFAVDQAAYKAKGNQYGFSMNPSDFTLDVNPPDIDVFSTTESNKMNADEIDDLVLNNSSPVSLDAGACDSQSYKATGSDKLSKCYRKLRIRA